MKKKAVKTRKKPEVVLTLAQHHADVKRYIGVVTEEFQHRVSAIGEQFSGLHEKLDEHTHILGRLMVDVEDIKVNMQEKVSRSEFNKLETRLVSLESFVFSGKRRVPTKKK